MKLENDGICAVPHFTIHFQALVQARRFVTWILVNPTSTRALHPKALKR